MWASDPTTLNMGGGVNSFKGLLFLQEYDYRQSMNFYQRTRCPQ
jgi:hypothetical protein